VEEEIKKNDDRVNLTKIYCKHFCKCHNVPQYKNNIILKVFKRSLVCLTSQKLANHHKIQRVFFKPEITDTIHCIFLKGQQLEVSQIRRWYEYESSSLSPDEQNVPSFSGILSHILFLACV
jgi:hypothetical protein